MGKEDKKYHHTNTFTVHAVERIQHVRQARIAFFRVLEFEMVENVIEKENRLQRFSFSCNVFKVKIERALC